ncbi:protein kinase, partial [bacterium]|nr:protein kinase [bacterium]
MEMVGRTIAGYKLTAEIGHGGMGTVYRAEGLGRAVALKVLKKHQARVSERFRREGELLAKVGSHPHVVAIHAAGEEDGLPFIVMELVDGGSLEEKLPLTVSEATRIVEEVARAVEHLHRLGIIHRDIKPGNVLIARDGRAKLTDFGLARDLARQTRLTGAWQVVGTPFYMAPEQLRVSDSEKDPEPGPLTDVYAMGALLYAALVGRPPYSARTLAELVGLIATAEPPRASAERAEVPPDLDEIVRKALAKDPLDRYPTAEAFAQDLARQRRGEPVLARPSSSLVRIVRRARRDPKGATAVGLACLFALSAPPLFLLEQRYAEQRAAAAAAEDRRSRFVSAVESGTAEAEAELARGTATLAAHDAKGARERAQAALEQLQRVPPPLEGASEATTKLRAAQVKTHRLLGDCARALGEDALALESYRAAWALDPASIELACRLAEAAAQARDLSTAAAVLATFPEGAVSRPDVQRARGLVLLARGEAREAQKVLAPLAHTGPDPAPALLGLARAQLASGDAKACLATLQGLDKSAHGSAQAVRLRARAMLALGDELAADRELEKAVEREPSDPALALDFARDLIRRGEVDRALALAGPLAKLAPADALIETARALVLEGEIGKAREALASCAARPEGGPACASALTLLAALERS